jgi:hypothetical protein
MLQAGAHKKIIRNYDDSGPNILWCVMTLMEDILFRANLNTENPPVPILTEEIAPSSVRFPLEETERLVGVFLTEAGRSRIDVSAFVDAGMLVAFRTRDLLIGTGTVNHFNYDEGRVSAFTVLFASKWEAETLIKSVRTRP